MKLISNVLFWIVMATDYFALFYCVLRLYRIPGNKKLLKRYPEETAGGRVGEHKRRILIKGLFTVILLMLNILLFIRIIGRQLWGMEGLI